ncbi:hypothetical protein B0H13DRAFT_1526078, partial [Mycena leptocephala]
VYMLIIRKIDDMQLGLYRTEFYAACINGKTEVVKALLQVGMRLNVDRGDYGTVLCAASANGKTEVVKALLRMGARRDVEG